MIAEQKEDFDYQEDVANLKRVWEEIKEPRKRPFKQNQSNAQAVTQDKSINQTKNRSFKNKNTKVVVSDQNCKKTIRNPKSKPQEVIQVFTRPQKTNGHPLKNERNNSAPEYLIQTNPEKQFLSETEHFKKNIADKDYELSLLRVSNSHNEDKIRRLESIIENKDATIEQLRNRLQELTNKLSALNSKDFNFNYGKVQYQNYRHDSRRLLKLLKSTQEYQKFADLAIDDDGVRFLTNANKSIKTKLDAPSHQNHFHFCTCNKAFIPEAFLWVPEKVYEFGRDFIKDRSGNLSQAELELLLYELNKIWRQREKRIINHVNAQKAHEIGKIKRKTEGITNESKTNKRQRD